VQLEIAYEDGSVQKVLSDESWKAAPSPTVYNDIINKIHHASEWSFISNFLGYPTDCPQREKNGWTGDAHLSAETGLLTFKPQAAYTKWLYDCQDAQEESGLLPGIVPTSGWGYSMGGKRDGYGPAWDGAYIWVPWYMYQYSGDKQVLRTHYENMKRSIGFMTDKSENHILAIGLGDWVFINTYAPRNLTSTACYYDLTSKVTRNITRQRKKPMPAASKPPWQQLSILTWFQQKM
jgi:alpha-L-rhamnosidase